MRRLGSTWIGVGTLLFALGCKGLLAAPAESVAEKWLRLGAADDLEQVATLVDPECLDHRPTINVAPTHVLGARITIDELSVAPLSQDEERATVAYQLKGHIEPGDRKMKIGKIEIKTDVSVDAIENSGEIELRRVGSEWKVTCR